MLDFEAADGKAHIVDVTVTEVPNKGKSGGTVNRYQWDLVAHSS